ncbi:MAG TPA: DUF3606 domain-containing protein [Sphingomonas sp.]|nr:DUF3606 domain-containing protein [Sphingomonas sp.]
MVDNPALRSGQDRTRIALEQEHEVRYWTGELGVTREQLAEAISAVGNQANDVRSYFEREANRTGG